MIDFYKNSIKILKKTYLIQKYDKSFYTDDGRLIAKPSTFLNDLVNSSESNLTYDTYRKIISFDVNLFDSGLREIYIENFFDKLFSDEVIINGLRNNHLKLVLIFSDELCELRKSLSLEPDINTYQNMLNYAFESHGFARTNLVILTRNLYLGSDEYHIHTPYNIVGDNLTEYEYVQKNRPNRITLVDYISDIRKLNKNIIKINNTDSIYNFILLKYLKDSKNIDNVIIDNISLDYNYEDVKRTFDNALDICKSSKLNHLEKYFNITTDEYDSLQKFNQTDLVKEKNNYGTSLCTLCLNLSNNDDELFIDTNVFDAISKYQPIIFVGPNSLIDSFTRMGYRRYFFIHNDKLTDNTISFEAKMVCLINDLNSLFNTSLEENIKNIENYTNILEYNNNTLYNLDSTYRIVSKLLSHLLSNIKIGPRKMLKILSHDKLIN